MCVVVIPVTEACLLMSKLLANGYGVLVRKPCLLRSRLKFCVCCSCDKDMSAEIDIDLFFCESLPGEVKRIFFCGEYLTCVVHKTTASAAVHFRCVVAVVDICSRPTRAERDFKTDCVSSSMPLHLSRICRYTNSHRHLRTRNSSQTVCSVDIDLYFSAE